MIHNIQFESDADKSIDLAVNSLKKGELIVYPTDTLYSIGCDIFNKRSVEKIYKIKKLRKNKPLSFICSDFKHLSEYANVSNKAFRLMKDILPGPFTCILPATRKVPKIMVSKQRTVGIRIPDNDFIRNVVQRLDNPIVTTTLPSIGEKTLLDPSAMYHHFKDKVEMFFSNGSSFSDPSTVLDLSSLTFTLLRQGKGHIDIL
tara:strand:- start:376 stop:981 length:606 start_codon:yes stop_codon:yes gene_type:complete